MQALIALPCDLVNSFPFNHLSTKVIEEMWQHCYILLEMLLKKLDHTMILMNVKICLEIERAQLIKILMRIYEVH